MPGQKRKYNVRFPPGRIKKIMQKDTEVGRMATAVPVIISKALEMFLLSFLTKTSLITQSANSRVMSINHMKRCIESEKLFDFLKELAERTHGTSTPQEGKAKGKRARHRKKWHSTSINTKSSGMEDLAKRTNQPEVNSNSSSVGRTLITFDTKRCVPLMFCDVLLWPCDL
ncbi:dr1-associated corepressor isoform X1 [Electrophorus electricus]|uniref:dr1-associated corepressor isoform X1 n=1 Tax=Electrophorus electricus TaxID=8005 RepID=UPI000F0A50A2|nr:dr1-associated corepressor isoform X1 [Electrophorus electricus]